jgi:hypothetical protein
MKTFRLFILICISSFYFNTDYSQSYVPIGAKWYYNVTDVTPGHNGYRMYEYVGDSILGAKTAMKIKKVLHQTTNVIIDEGYDLLAYEDSVLYFWDASHYQLMCDFKATTGDTLDITVDNSSNNCVTVSDVVVESTGFNQINGISLKKIFIQYELHYQEIWGGTTQTIHDSIIQRIGHIESFIFAPSCIIGDVFGYQGMRCYEDNEINRYMVNWDYGNMLSCDTLYIWTGIENIKNDDFNLNVYPNPIENKLVIEIPETINKLTSLTIGIYSSNGVLIKDIETNGENVINIDMKNYAKGLYLIKLNCYNKNIQIIKKVIKI